MIENQVAELEDGLLEASENANKAMAYQAAMNKVQDGLGELAAVLAEVDLFDEYQSKLIMVGGRTYCRFFISLLVRLNDITEQTFDKLGRTDETGVN